MLKPERLLIRQIFPEASSKPGTVLELETWQRDKQEKKVLIELNLRVIKTENEKPNYTEC